MSDGPSTRLLQKIMEAVAFSSYSIFLIFSFFYTWSHFNLFFRCPALSSHDFGLSPPTSLSAIWMVKSLEKRDSDSTRGWGRRLRALTWKSLCVSSGDGGTHRCSMFFFDRQQTTSCFRPAVEIAIFVTVAVYFV